MLSSDLLAFLGALLLLFEVGFCAKSRFLGGQPFPFPLPYRPHFGALSPFAQP